MATIGGEGPTIVGMTGSGRRSKRRDNRQPKQEAGRAPKLSSSLFLRDHPRKG